MPNVLKEKPKVLIVDNRPENLTALRAALESPDYTITECLSGNEAIKLVFDDNFDVILLDVHMPDLDGFQTAEIIRSRPKGQFIPLIFVTAQYLDEPSSIRGYNLGAVDYIMTPFRPETLQKKVEFFIKYGPKLREEQHKKDFEIIYGKFHTVFKELINPLWSILLNVQLLKKFSEKDKEKLLLSLNKKLDALEHATQLMNHLILNYKDQLEEGFNLDGMENESNSIKGTENISGQENL